MIKSVLSAFKNTKDIFLFQSVYQNPKRIFGSFIEMSIEEYYLNPQFHYYLLNNDFINFLNSAIDEKEFLDRLDMNLLEILINIINLSINFKDEFEANIEAIKKANSKQLVNLRFSNLFDVYYFRRKKTDKEIFLEKINTYDSSLAEEVKKVLNDLELERDALKNASCRKIFLINRILQDKYDGESYLETQSFLLKYKVSFEMLCSFVCANEFVLAIESLFFQKKLTGLALKNAIEIILYSIKVKTMSSDISEEQRKLVDKNLIKSFDLEKAQDILNKLIAYEQKQINNCGLRLIRRHPINEQKS